MNYCMVCKQRSNVFALQKSLKYNSHNGSPIVFTYKSIYTKVEPIGDSVSEVEIKVPWGIVAGKLWGDHHKQPVLALHGWQDNAGTFDTLAPLIKTHAPILAIDLPGHGLSSWLPLGQMNSGLSFVMIIKRLKLYFGWTSVKLLAHSLGAQLSFWYASLYPNETDFVICLDHLKLPSANVEKYLSSMPIIISKIIELDGKSNIPPSYSKEELTERWVKASNSLDAAGVHKLMVRGATKNSDGTYCLNRDPRLRFFPIDILFSQDHLLRMTKEITCPYLVLKATDAEYYDTKENYLEALEVLKKSSRDCCYSMLPGTHHFHLMNPKPVAEIIKPFLQEYY